MNVTIESIKGYEILNGKGKPTVEAVLTTSNGISVTASAPSGASTGRYEAYELYDGGTRYNGFGTTKASAGVSNEICQALKGVSVTDQAKIDRILCELDGTPNKSRLGGNAILPVSLAAAKAGALASGLPLYRYLGGFAPRRIPAISSTVISGGAFSPSGLEFEDYLLILDGFSRFSEATEALLAMREEMLKRILKRVSYCLEDAGALAPELDSTDEAFAIILDAARAVGCESCVHLGLDVAANELYDPDTNTYVLSKKRTRYTAAELCTYYRNLCRDYPLIYIEDPFEEDAFGDYARLKAAVPNIMVSGDDLFATNIERLKMGIEHDSANTLLFKINQIGTVSEAFSTAMFAIDNGYSITASGRSGESLDDFSADLAVAIGAQQMKMGSPVRGERNAKFNRLMRIESELFPS
ncbi:phosphopyruvate hydratase [Enterocloster lavalensis]|uniref:phosphopyruvate hydratase n=1 Tax=Enterocloster lavalensis TaxID=460384 RepID=UPI00140DB58D|nr:phosphopyruvate hydratase [Enterocloster lavalensis]